MTASNFSFNISEAGEDRFIDGFSLIPGGWYAAKITEDKLEPTGDGDGMILNQTYVISGNDHAGRKLFDRVCVKHDSNDGWLRQGRAKLATILDALGMKAFKTTAEIQNKLIAIKVVEVDAVMEPDGVTVKYKAKNEIRGWKPIGELEKLKAEYKASAGTSAKPAQQKAAAKTEDFPADPFGQKDTAKAPAETTSVATSEAAPAQPWEAEDAPPPVVDEAPAAPAAKTAEQLMEEDGWKAHPQNASFVYKGKEVVKRADKLAEFEMTLAVPAVDDAPMAPPMDSGEEVPPWASSN